MVKLKYIRVRVTYTNKRGKGTGRRKERAQTSRGLGTVF